eukprot:1161583-Pelagomonas_calceolata.AAC.3
MKAPKRQRASTTGIGKLPETPTQEEQQLPNVGVHLDFVRFSTAASEEHGIVRLACLHMKEHYSHLDATMLQLHCCGQFVQP